MGQRRKDNVISKRAPKSVMTNNRIWHCIYCVFPWNLWSPNKSSHICHLRRWTNGNRESTKICNRVLWVTYTLCSGHSDIKEEDIAICLFGSSTTKQLLDILDSTQSMCTKSNSHGHWGRGRANNRDLSVLQKYYRPAVVEEVVELVVVVAEGLGEGDVSSSDITTELFFT